MTLDYWAELDQQIENAVVRDQVMEKIEKLSEREAYELPKSAVFVFDLTEGWMFYIWRKHNRKREAYYQEMHALIVARGLEPVVHADEQRILRHFRKMVETDALPRLRAHPRYRMAAMLGEF